ILPLCALVLFTMEASWSDMWDAIKSDRAIAAYWLSFGGACVAALMNTMAGLLLAWVLVRYRFFGRGVIDALIDLPFALPTAVAGIALTTLYASNAPLGRYLRMFGIEVVYTELGVVLALTFVGLPFVVRTVQPVLQNLDLE